MESKAEEYRKDLREFAEQKRGEVAFPTMIQGRRESLMIYVLLDILETLERIEHRLPGP
jgi:hypothetical protein